MKPIKHTAVPQFFFKFSLTVSQVVQNQLKLKNNVIKIRSNMFVDEISFNLLFMAMFSYNYLFYVSAKNTKNQ